MGVVYRATQLALDRPVALKAIAPQFAADAEYRERFQRESHLAASIDHPNVIPVYEAGELDGTLYLIMRWVDGTDLRALLRADGRLQAGRAVRLLRPVAAALAAAHRRGLVHRDVKPANVLIAQDQGDGDEHVYLTDFGIARRTDTRGAVTRSGVLVGTVDYIAPERIEGARGTPASDIYAFGCMLFETLTGHVPFAQRTGLLKMHAHLNDPVPSAHAEAEDVPEHVDAIIATAMAKQPDARYPSAGELAAALGAALAEIEAAEAATARIATVPTAPAATVSSAVTTATESTATEDRPAPTRAAPPRTRTRALVAAAVVGVVAAGAAIALLASSGGGGGSPGVSSQDTAAPPATSGTRDKPPVTSPGLGLGHTVAIGGVPGAVTADASGNVWVSETHDRTIARVDGSSGQKTEFKLDVAPKLLAATPRGLWVSATDGSLELFDPAADKPVAHAALATAPVALAGGGKDGSVWAAEPDGSITHFTAAGTPDGAVVTVKPAPLRMGTGEGWLWAVDGVQLTRIGSALPHSVTKFPAVRQPLDVTFDQGVWTANDDGTVTRFDPRAQSLTVKARRRVASGLNAIAAVEHQPFVWTTSTTTKTAYRLSTAPGAPPSGSAKFASAPVGLAVVAGSAWVATADGTLWQIRF